MKTEWNVCARARVCAACGEAFGDGDACQTRLAFREGAWQRTDVCAECVPTLSAPEGPVSAWRWTYRTPETAATRVEPVRRQTGEAMLRRLLDVDDPADINVVYVLAVLLERARVLVERDVRPGPDGTRLRLYEHRRDGDMFRVRDPGLRLDALEAVQVEVLQRLDGGTEAGAAPAPPASSGAA